MFEHSIKVPRLYKLAAKIVKAVIENGSNIKQLVYECKHTNIKALYALVVETLKRNNEINILLDKSKIFEKETRLDEWLARVLITELVWRKNQLPGQSKPVQIILAYELIFKGYAIDLERKNSTPIMQVTRPRYARVNTLRVSTNDAVDAFCDDGWQLVRFPDKNDLEGFLDKVISLGRQEFLIDIHVDDLLIFPQHTEFYRHSSYISGSVLLQEKASCLPVQILNPPPGSTILDMCAAPGNKTTQLAAKMNDNGLIYAVDMDPNRTAIMERMVENSTATCVRIINRDVLTITDAECPNVEYILVDPSCTGSGITNRFEFMGKEDKIDPVRLQKLRGFQIKILKHALKNFPSAKRVVYSTCSILQQENEEVVQEVLKSCRNFKLIPIKYELSAPWKNFGSPDFGEIGEYCLYTKPDDDLTIGFFIAAFDRLKEDEVNPHLQIKSNDTWTNSEINESSSTITEKKANEHNKSSSPSDNSQTSNPEVHDKTMKTKRNKKNTENTSPKDISSLKINEKDAPKKNKKDKKRSEIKIEDEQNYQNSVKCENLNKKRQKSESESCSSNALDTIDENVTKKKKKKTVLESDVNDSATTKTNKKKKLKTEPDDDMEIAEDDCNIRSKRNKSTRQKSQSEVVENMPNIPTEKNKSSKKSKKKLEKDDSIENVIQNNENIMDDLAERTTKNKKKLDRKAKTEGKNFKPKRIKVENEKKTKKRAKI